MEKFIEKLREYTKEVPLFGIPTSKKLGLVKEINFEGRKPIETVTSREDAERVLSFLLRGAKLNPKSFHISPVYTIEKSTKTVGTYYLYELSPLLMIGIKKNGNIVEAFDMRLFKLSIH